MNEPRREVEIRYANSFRTGSNRDEFVIELGQCFEGKEIFYCSLVCTPPHAQELFRLLGRSLDGYREEYGPIPEPEVD